MSVRITSILPTYALPFSYHFGYVCIPRALFWDLYAKVRTYTGLRSVIHLLPTSIWKLPGSPSLHTTTTAHFLPSLSVFHFLLIVYSINSAFSICFCNHSVIIRKHQFNPDAVSPPTVTPSFASFASFAASTKRRGGEPCKTSWLLLLLVSALALAIVMLQLVPEKDPWYQEPWYWYIFVAPQGMTLSSTIRWSCRYIEGFTTQGWADTHINHQERSPWHDFHQEATKRSRHFDYCWN